MKDMPSSFPAAALTKRCSPSPSAAFSYQQLQLSFTQFPPAPPVYCMQDSSSLNLISAYSDSDASDREPSPPHPPLQTSTVQPDVLSKVFTEQALLASQELQVSLDITSTHTPPTYFCTSPQIKVRRAVQHSLSTGRTFNEQLRSHTDFRNPAIVTQLAARFAVALLDSNLSPSVWSPRGLDPEGTCVMPASSPNAPLPLLHFAPLNCPLLIIIMYRASNISTPRAQPRCYSSCS